MAGSDNGEVSVVEGRQFGDVEALTGDDQRAPMRFEERQAGAVVPIVGIDVGVERPGVDDESYGDISEVSISSMRSAMSS